MPSENTLPLGAIDCPPNSLALAVTNFGITRVTMQQLHGVLRDVEALKYNDAQFQQLLVLQNRDSQTKKGIFTDNFQNESQADPFFPGYSARIDGLRQYAAPRRTTLTTALTIDAARSTVRRFASLALLPGTEVVAIDQPEWSELRNVNPFAAFGKPPAEIRVTPNFARRLRTLVTVSGVHFNPSVSNVTVKLDGIVVASNVSTDPYGRLAATFSVSQLWRWGWRTVEASDGTNVARANLRLHDLDYIYRVERVAVEEDGSTRAIRELVATQPIASAKVYAEMSVPSGTTVVWSASNDGGATWEPMAQESARPLNDTWTEYVLGRAFASPAGNRIRFKAVMAGTALVTPRIHSLGATLA